RRAHILDRSGRAAGAARVVGQLTVVLDPLDRARRHAGGDRERLDIVEHDAVRSDHAALADRYATRDDGVCAAPDVVADPGRPLAREALVGDRLVRIVETVVRVA